MAKKIRYNIDVSFYSLEFSLKADNAKEARKKAKEIIKRNINANIRQMYLNKQD